MQFSAIDSQKNKLKKNKSLFKKKFRNHYISTISPVPKNYIVVWDIYI